MKRQLQVRLVKAPKTEETGTIESHFQVTPDNVKEYMRMGALLFAAAYGSKAVVDVICKIAEARFS